MKCPFLSLVKVLCLSSPALASAQSLDCPAPAPIVVEANATTFNLPELAQTVGTFEIDGESLRKIAGQLRADFPVRQMRMWPTS
ncbi:hypothetical protein [Ponticoccus alexandrii]|uniref:hypothetical protein n=1 Tax=Ponticoccus alexandrii TaxID=1943633 RepID=UPI0003D1AD17|nr:hypothetical protein [Ponticoccus alexandrii]